MSKNIQAVILAGGFGTRLAEETHLRPKPMVQIGNMPILWHIMKIYEHHGVNDFIICGGYKVEIIKEFFINYKFLKNDFSIDFDSGQMMLHSDSGEKWKVTIADTGYNAFTGGRILAIKKFLRDDQPFLLTYGDGVGDIDVRSSIDYHYSHGRQATVTVTRPEPRFGTPEIEQGQVIKFSEKAPQDVQKVNAGFFVLNKSVIDLIDGPSCVWEEGPLGKLADAGELMAFDHDGFWKPMDTLRDKKTLNDLWESGSAPWKKWE